MKTISLTQGKVAIVDDEDYEYLSKYKWYAYRIEKLWYAGRSDRSKKKRRICMHRQILNISSGLKTDHRDGDGLNNQKKNLRICNNAQNTRNAKMRKGTSSQYKGVSWHKNGKRWQAQIKYCYKAIYLGLFKTEKEAAQAYNKAAKKYFGEFARLNFQ